MLPSCRKDVKLLLATEETSSINKSAKARHVYHLFCRLDMCGLVTGELTYVQLREIMAISVKPLISNVVAYYKDSEKREKEGREEKEKTT